MSLLSIEHSATAYRADFLIYGGAVLALATWLAMRGPAGMGLEITALAGAGWLLWSALEYGLHRFVLHGLPPFKRWHQEHHRHPAALICAPTLLSGSLMVLLVWLPSVWWLGNTLGCALTLGVLMGYLAYAVAHHAVHHWRSRNVWLQWRKFEHARHHHLQQPCCYGVTSGLWDQVFRTAWRKEPGRLHIPVVRRQG